MNSINMFTYFGLWYPELFPCIFSAVFSPSVLIYDIGEKGVCVWRHGNKGTNTKSARDDDKFSILLWVHVRRVCIKATDNLRRGFQDSFMRAAKGQRLAEDACKK